AAGALDALRSAATTKLTMKRYDFMAAFSVKTALYWSYRSHRSYGTQKTYKTGGTWGCCSLRRRREFPVLDRQNGVPLVPVADVHLAGQQTAIDLPRLVQVDLAGVLVVGDKRLEGDQFVVLVLGFALQLRVEVGAVEVPLGRHARMLGAD